MSSSQNPPLALSGIPYVFLSFLSAGSKRSEQEESEKLRMLKGMKKHLKHLLSQPVFKNLMKTKYPTQSGKLLVSEASGEHSQSALGIVSKAQAKKMKKQKQKTKTKQKM